MSLFAAISNSISRIRGFTDRLKVKVKSPLTILHDKFHIFSVENILNVGVSLDVSWSSYVVLARGEDIPEFVDQLSCHIDKCWVTSGKILISV